jgi:hypothetical protein
VSDAHPEVPPELRRLAQSILDRLDPAVRLAAARAAAGRDSRCQQVWCPVCALAALVTGEQHPLLTVIADHSIALLSVVRAMTDAMDTGQGRPPEPPADPSGRGGPTPDGSGPDDDGPPPGPGRYQHIPVSVEE